jgi:hypothetical protein
MARQLNGRVLVHGNQTPDEGVYPLLVSNVPLSFWGGIDETTGIVIDTTHPLHGKSVAGTILCLPSGRGSSTASQVLLELILNDKAPQALILRDRDGQIAVGALVAKSVFPDASVLDVIQIEGFDELLHMDPKYGKVMLDGSLVVGREASEVEHRAHQQQLLLEPTTGHGGARKVPELLVLNEEEQAMKKNACTDAERRAVDCIIAYGRILTDHPTYVDVENAHIDGCTYIGPGGLRFAERLVEDGGKVKIPTTLNSVSTDLRYWERLGIIPTESQQASIKLAQAYVALGCSERSFTCAPYLLEGPPMLNQQIVWGESNAVVFANSVLGARTEKYADYLDICCAIVGKVPAVGVHLADRRIPTVVLDASAIDFSIEDPDEFALLFPVLGHVCGSLSDGDVPILVGLERCKDVITKDHLKSFCAAYGTTGTSPLIHIAGITPEAIDAQDLIAACERRILVTCDDLEKTFRLLDQESKNRDDTIHWIALGNPHMSLSECDDLRALIDSLPESTNKSDKVEMIACMSRVIFEQSTAVQTLERFGVKIVQDTCWCMLLQPPMIPSDPEARILTTSGKYAHYGPGLTGRKFRLGSLSECVDAAVSGRLTRRQPSRFPWMEQRRQMSSWNAADLNPASFQCRRIRTVLKYL